MNIGKVRFSIYFEKRDAWIGVYWNRLKRGFADSPVRCHEYSIYICLLPFFSIRITWIYGYKMIGGQKVELENLEKM